MFGQYIGYWKNGLRHGKGSFIQVNGNLAMGSWKNDKRAGYFEITLYDGVVMKGDFVDG